MARVLCYVDNYKCNEKLAILQSIGIIVIKVGNKGGADILVGSIPTRISAGVGDHPCFLTFYYYDPY